MLICLFTSPSEYCIIKHWPASLMAVCLRTMSTRTACLIQFTSSLHISHELCRTQRWGNSSLLMCCFSGVKVWGPDCHDITHSSLRPLSCPLKHISNQIKSNHFYCHITTAQVPWWVKFLWACSRQCKKIFFYIWTVHIYRLYRRQCAKYTYIYSVHIVYYKDILNYQLHIIHRMGTSTLCTLSIHYVVYT